MLGQALSIFTGAIHINSSLFCKQSIRGKTSTNITLERINKAGAEGVGLNLAILANSYSRICSTGCQIRHLSSLAHLASCNSTGRSKNTASYINFIIINQLGHALGCTISRGFGIHSHQLQLFAQHTLFVDLLYRQPHTVQNSGAVGTIAAGAFSQSTNFYNLTILFITTTAAHQEAHSHG